LLIFLLLVGSAAGGAYFLYLQKSQVPVKVGEVKRGEMLITVSATTTGTIESEGKVTLSGQTVGRLLRFLVEEGDRVRKGQLLAQLDPEEAQAQLRLAEANLQSAQARLQQAEAGVAMQDTQIRSEISQTRANLEQAEADLRRMEKLHRDGYASQQQLDAASAEYEVAKAAHQSALSRVDENIVKARDVAAARAVVKQTQASCELAKVQLGYTTIHSPLDGIVSEKLIEEGELVRAGVPILSLVDPKQLYVKATIDEYDAQKVKLGQEALIRVDAFPGETLEGKVYQISPIVSGGKLETRTFSVKVSLDSNHPVKAGMSADVEIVVSKLDNVLFVPSLAVVEKEARRLVFVVEGSRARLQPIQTGDSNWTYVEVKGGLSPGARVVLNPDLNKLKDGGRVKVEGSSNQAGNLRK
jgi:HlyD family secretion protein